MFNSCWHRSGQPQLWITYILINIRMQDPNHMSSGHVLEPPGRRGTWSPSECKSPLTKPRRYERGGFTGPKKLRRPPVAFYFCWWVKVNKAYLLLRYVKVETPRWHHHFCWLKPHLNPQYCWIMMVISPGLNHFELCWFSPHFCWFLLTKTRQFLHPVWDSQWYFDLTQAASPRCSAAALRAGAKKRGVSWDF